MIGYLMDHLIPRVRKVAYEMIIKTYSPTIPISFISKELRFHKATIVDDDASDQEIVGEQEQEEGDLSACLEFIYSLDGFVVESLPLCLDTKKSRTLRSHQ
mmetsp:Transcript_46939/g.60313  ORF Transcript_46939/g.60313 Transcript_46939/m.60313 type:complete len:101 (+) Transcript_46939:3-305(+)